MKSTTGIQTIRPSPLRERYLALLPLVMAAATYLGTLRFGFVYDDFPQIVSNPFIKAWAYVPQYFVSSVWKQVLPLSTNNYYRPLFILLLRVSYSMFGARPLGWHLTAVSLHLAVTWLVYRTVKKVSGQFTLAWLSALIFATHPVHHEVVAWVSGMTESLCALFFVGSFLAYLESRERSKTLWATLSCALYGAALLAKETAVVLPALAFVYEYFEYEGFEGGSHPAIATRFRRAAVATCFYIPVAAAYLVARSRVLMGIGYSNGRVPLSTWLRTLPSLLTAYAAHWVHPVRLAEFYDILYQPRLNFAHVILPTAILVLAVGALWIVRKQVGSRLLGLAAAWVIIPLLPALDTFVFSPQELVHDRYLYIPSIGAALLTALIIDRAAKPRTGPFGLPWHVTAAGLALSAVLALLGARAASYWASDYSLFSRAHEIAPSNSKAAVNLGADLMGLGKFAEAQDLFETSYQQHSDDPGVAAYLGRVHYFKKEFQPAEYYTRQAIALNPSMPDGYFFLGQIQLKQNHLEEAKESMRRATELNPYSAQFRIGYGIVLQVTGDCERAAQQIASGLDLDPSDLVAQRLQTLRCRTAQSPQQMAPSKRDMAFTR